MAMGSNLTPAFPGLGLFIVRQMVERNKGRISVESAVGKGTTFFLDFPAAQTAAVTS